MAPPRKIRVKCLVPSCADISKHGDYCGKHYKRRWRHGSPSFTMIRMHAEGEQCSARACDKLAKKQGFCENHYRGFLRNGHPELTRAPNGSGSYTAAGYKVLPNGEYEHRAIAEKALGKPLPPKAVVHHITEDPDDNHGPWKLVICPDQAYHLLIHRLMREKGISFHKPVNPEIAALTLDDL